MIIAKGNNRVRVFYFNRCNYIHYYLEKTPIIFINALYLYIV